MRYMNSGNLKLLQKCIRQPRTAARLLKRLPPEDALLASRLNWVYGALPGTPLLDLFPDVKTFSLHLINAFDRERTTSVTLDELSCMVAVARNVSARTILEIGTFEGNTALNFAANTDADVVTVDLPPTFDREADRQLLTFPQVTVNLTMREHLARQLRGHPLAPRVRCVHGDSAALDWSTLGGPFDVIFIDGCHDYDYVMSDTENGRKHLANNGVIFWHDYRMIGSVSRAVDDVATLADDLVVCAIEGTRLAVAVKSASAAGARFRAAVVADRHRRAAVSCTLLSPV